MKLLDELKGLIDRLEKSGIDYALCGGLALAVYEMPRATLDIDLMVEPDMLERVRGIADQAGFSIAASPMEFKDGKVIIHRVTKIDSDTHEALVLDLLLVTNATRPAWTSRKTAQWRGGKLKILTPQGLIDLKSLRNSSQDQQDIEYLRSIADEN